ncbi:hypothetical protein Tco_0152535 [Tanacetum coccineum]
MLSDIKLRSSARPPDTSFKNKAKPISCSRSLEALVPEVVAKVYNILHGVLTTDKVNILEENGSAPGQGSSTNNPPYKYQYTVALATPGIDGTLQQPKEEVTETYATVLEETKKWIDAEAGVVQTILTGIDNDIYLKWQRFVTLVKRSQELKTVSYHKLYDFLKQHQNEVNEIRAKILARTANPLALVAQQQPVYYPQPNPTHYTQSLSTKSQAATKNKGKANSNSPPTYDQEPKVVADDEASSKEKEIDKLMALISITKYDRLTGQYYNQRAVNVTRARENVGTQIQEVIPDAVDNFRPIFDTKPFEKGTESDLSQLRKDIKNIGLLQGFNSSRLHFLNFFNDPRIIREQRIAANWV